MKTRMLSLLAVVALALGSFALVASAQSYGEEPETSTSSESSNTDVSADGAAAIIEIQATDEDAEGASEDAEADETAEESTDTGRRSHRGGCNLDAAAAAIGIDEADLQTALAEGQSIAQVAEANGVDAQTVIDAMVDAKAERLAEKVESGRITQEEADQKLADTEDRVTDQVNDVDDEGGTDA